MPPRADRLASFKAYDIRGRIPDELNEELVYAIGQAYAGFLSPRRVAVGYDIRLSSEGLAERLRAEHDALPDQLKAAYQLTISRDPATDELKAMSAYASEFGLANACRVMLNLNEFVFVD